jgi:hypothetical protein
MSNETRSKSAKGRLLRRGWFAAAGGLCTVTSVLFFLACGDEVAWIAVDLSISKGKDPFEGVAVVRLTVTGPATTEPMSAETPYERQGQVHLTPISEGKDRVITVEGLDADRVAISRGQSARFDVTADSPQRVSVPFARCTIQIYRDADLDGYGDAGLKKEVCFEGAGYVADKKDCDDGDDNVHPGQQKFFSVPALGSHRFDYDCDGKEEPELNGKASCAETGPDCKGSAWSGGVPACGQTGVFVKCEKKGGDCVEAAGQTKTQACR